MVTSAAVLAGDVADGVSSPAIAGAAFPADLAGVVTLGVASLANARVASLTDSGMAFLVDLSRVVTVGVTSLADARAASLADAGMAFLADPAGVVTIVFPRTDFRMGTETP